MLRSLDDGISVAQGGMQDVRVRDEHAIEGLESADFGLHFLEGGEHGGMLRA